MTRDTGPRYAHRPAVEPLEGRALLSGFYTGPSAVRPVQSSGGVYTLTMSGPGLVKVTHAAHGQIGVVLFGTTPTSTLNVALTRPRLHKASSALQIASIRVASGQLGGIVAPGADLDGAISPLSGQVNALEFADLGSNAQIDAGGIGSLSVSGSVSLGPTGHVKVGGVGQALSIGSLNLAGGRLVVANDLTGTLNLGALNLSQGGQFLIGHDLTGAATVSGSSSITGGSLFSIGHNLSGSQGLAFGRDLTLDSGGQLAVGNDLTGPLNVGGTLSISNRARLIVNLDSSGAIGVSGDLDLASGGALAVNRTLNSLTVNGNLSVAPTGGGITVGGDLTTLTVDGSFSGRNPGRKSGNSPADLTVGLNLGALNVLGGGSNQGGLQGVDVNVEKSILGLNVPHGIFDSFITAGVNINGGSTGANVGADGVDAVQNSEIRAGVSILNLTIGGDVRSTFVQDPNSLGNPTRIIAGEDRRGDYLNGGLIDNFQITGQLIDSVLAASVAPYGDSGTLPSSAYGTAPPSVSSTPGDLGFNTYDAPAGTTTGGTFGNPVVYQNYTELSYVNETLVGVSYNKAIDPTIDDTILFGAINPSFASPPSASTASTITTNGGTSGGTTSTSTVAAGSQAQSLPTKSTVLGGVISTPHGDEADYAGIFAADTRGVFVGPLP